jgi:two-component sensor histidine kinase
MISSHARGWEGTSLRELLPQGLEPFRSADRASVTLDGRDFEISPKTALALGQAKRRGFGLTMIERGLSLEPDGPVELDFAQTGLVCRIEIPLRHAEPWRVG